MEREEATAGEAKPAAGARRTRLVKVDQEIIDFMLKQGPASRRPLPVLSDKVADMPGKPGLRAIYARAAALVQRLIDRDEDILHQYRTKGYAEVEEEVSDDEATPPVRRRPATGRTASGGSSWPSAPGSPSRASSPGTCRQPRKPEPKISTVICLQDH